MPDASPWNEMGVPGLDYTVRLVAGDTPVPCYWGRDSSGRYLFIIELTGDYTAEFNQNKTASMASRLIFERASQLRPNVWFLHLNSRLTAISSKVYARR